MAAKRYRNPAPKEKKKAKGTGKNPASMANRNSHITEKSGAGEPHYLWRPEIAREQYIVRRIRSLPHLARSLAFNEMERVLDDIELLFFNTADQIMVDA